MRHQAELDINLFVSLLSPSTFIFAHDKGRRLLDLTPLFAIWLFEERGAVFGPKEGGAQENGKYDAACARTFLR